MTAQATGVFAIRFSPAGELEALAVSQLRSLNAGKLQLDLAEPVDLALWRNEQGELEGVIQGLKQPPGQLMGLSRHWTRLKPAP